MATRAIPLEDKRALAGGVRRHLVKLYGKRPNYSPPLVKAAMRSCRFPDYWDCWALSLFSSSDDFVSYHAARGEACDYTAMNSEMLGAVDSGTLLDFLSLDWSDAGTFSIFDSGSIEPFDHS